MKNNILSIEETLDRKHLESIQNNNFNNTINHMLRKNKNLPFSKLVDELKHIDINALSDFPFTTKSDFMDNYPFGLFSVDMKDVVKLHASSGTHGKPTVVGYTANDMKVWNTTVARGLSAIGVSNRDIIQISFGYGLFTGGFGMRGGAELLGATVVPASIGNTSRQVEMLLDYGVTVLACTPSYAIQIGETLKRMDMKPGELNLKIGVFGGEPWTESMRTHIEKLLNIKAYDIYGISEIIGPGVSFECCEKDGLHINEDHFIPEIVCPKTDNVLEAGEYGELVLSCVTKEAIPLIRYRTGDITRLNYSKCNCGRTTVRMEKPRGRVDDMLIIKGVNVFPTQIETVLLDSFNLVPHYQIVVSRKNYIDSLEINVELSEESTLYELAVREKISNIIQTKIKSKLGISVVVKLLPFGSLDRFDGKSNRVKDLRK